MPFWKFGKVNNDKVVTDFFRRRYGTSGPPARTTPEEGEEAEEIHVPDAPAAEAYIKTRYGYVSREKKTTI